MPDRALCKTPRVSDAEDRRSLPLVRGDICAIPASINNPFYDLFATSRVSMCTRTTRDTLAFLEANPYAGKTRPCVIYDVKKPSTWDANEIWAPVVCLMATVGGLENIQDMPRIYRHFFVPVHTPHNMESCSSREHIHTTPDWMNPSPQWVIACPYRPRNRYVDVRWKIFPSDTIPPEGTYHFGPAELQFIRDMFNSKMGEWEDMTPDQHRAYELELLRWQRKTRPANVKLKPRNHASDFDSVNSHLRKMRLAHAPSVRSAVTRTESLIRKARISITRTSNAA
ncbi:hypothetical protein PLICRDRAFT_31581 [Plicaturopsis crispa FD-325 SS-3]|nr:hypothetical protein PLICRDRAFT_31581 [Plicaturopsis crispa FD-325 SS-3]